jgi:hypothetical protein
VPAILPILALATRVSLGDIPVAILASPVALPVLALAGVPLGIVEVAVVAPPAVLPIAAFAGITLGGVPPVGGIVARAAALHGVAFWVADVAGRAGPVVLAVLAGSAGVAGLDVLFAVLAVPGHGYILSNRKQ